MSQFNPFATTARQAKYLKKLAEDIKAFKEKEASGQPISSRERRNIRARERRAIKKMKQAVAPLIGEANRILDLLRSEKIKTLSMQRLEDEFKARGIYNFTTDNVKTYNDIVEEITRASAFINAPESNVLAGKRYERNEFLQVTYGDAAINALKHGDFVEQGLIPTKEDAKIIFANYRRIEETWKHLIGKAGNDQVYGSDNLILAMIDFHNKGLNEFDEAEKLMETYQDEVLPGFKKALEKRNMITGISGLFEEGGFYGGLEGLL